MALRSLSNPICDIKQGYKRDLTFLKKIKPRNTHWPNESIFAGELQRTSDSSHMDGVQNSIIFSIFACNYRAKRAEKIPYLVHFEKKIHRISTAIW